MTADSKLEILVVEDEEPIRRGLCDVLAYHGYLPSGAGDGEAGLEAGLSNRFSLVVLDVMLPGISGFDVCAGLRERHPHLPILMLTARGSEEDVLKGFRSGADDYVTKPFAVAELMARVEAILRRTGALRPQQERSFAFDRWKIDPASLCAQCDDATVTLTQRECDILRLFLRDSGRIVSRRTLLAEVWGSANPDRVETRTVDMQMAKLRKKLELGTGEESIISTVRGAGYRFGGA
ncbi:MAG: response regulator transcription factor [bacterium]|nr:response regulator transcription factor [bacterium]